MTESPQESPKGTRNALEPIGEEIWIVEGEPVSFYGFPYPTRMAIVRLGNGDLWVWSPTDLTEGLRAEMDALVIYTDRLVVKAGVASGWKLDCKPQKGMAVMSKKR